MSTDAAVRERPILFSGEMVRAILDGRKSQTRRVADLPSDTRAVRWVENHETVPSGRYTGWIVECSAPLLLPRNCPYGRPGDRLWVRETWAPVSAAEEAAHGRGVLYRADPMFDDMEKGDFGWAWKPSIHMPRRASRITLEITELRVERVQEISEEDADAEGMALYAKGFDTLRAVFQSRWDALNARRGYGWDANPWVWVISFARLRQDAGALSRGEVLAGAHA